MPNRPTFSTNNFATVSARWSLGKVVNEAHHITVSIHGQWELEDVHSHALQSSNCELSAEGTATAPLGQQHSVIQELLEAHSRALPELQKSRLSFMLLFHQPVASLAPNSCT
jgi:hypothetical protein